LPEPGDQRAKLVEPGRPQRPELVHPRQLVSRKLHTPIGHAAFVHSICHIEFTAINLALDTGLRFCGMPPAYYRDWFAVAVEEATHFAMMSGHLSALGYRYGDFPAHGGLWDIAERSSADILQRLALVPRVMEARGLDVTPTLIDRLEEIGDDDGARILQRILEDEIEHVATGTRWFNYAARKRGDDPEALFGEIVMRHGPARTQNLNIPARLAAGFTQRELSLLASRRNRTVHGGEARTGSDDAPVRRR
jgi:uncharacterized ferritin-like protein (DUF455 family)